MISLQAGVIMKTHGIYQSWAGSADLYGGAASVYKHVFDRGVIPPVETTL